MGRCSVWFGAAVVKFQFRKGVASPRTPAFWLKLLLGWFGASRCFF